MKRRLALLALALLLPATALADPKDDARRHFMAGLEAAKEGEYEVALQRFLAAEEAYPHPATLFNIARAYTDLRDYDNALTYYHLFVEAQPERAEEVAEVIAVLESRIDAERAPVAPTEPAVTGTAGQVVVAGPSAEEVARLTALAAELEALARIIEDRSNTPVTMPVVPTGPGEGTGEGTPSEGTDTPDEGTSEGDTEISNLSGDFVADAYQRVVVTASRYGQEPIDSPSSVSIISDEDIRMSGATDVPDLLRRIVGVEVMSPTAAKPEVSIRGFNDKLANKVLVLIDGRSVYLDFLGTTMWSNLPVTLEEIERIEVIRGPGSAVYGANAMTGVINILTRAPGEGKNLVRFDSGTLGYSRGVVLASGRVKGTAYRFSGQLQQKGRWARDAQLTDDSALSSYVDNQDLSLDNLSFNGRLDRTFGEEGFASISGGYLEGQQEFYSLGVLGNYFFDSRNHYVRGDVAYGPVHLRSFWNHEDGTAGPWLEYRDTPRSLITSVDNDTVDVELEASTTFETGALSHRLNGGLGYRYKKAGFGYLEADSIVEHHEDVFLSEEASLDRLKVVGTFRLDNHPLIPLDKTISPRGSVIYRVFDKTSLRATGGSSFRAPNFIESYLDLQLDSGIDGVFIQDYGSRDLLPERILTGEIGIHDESTLYHTADAAVYVNRVTHLIGLLPVTGGADWYDDDANGYLAGTTGFGNYPEVYTGLGFEAEAEFFPANGLDVYTNVDVESIRVDDGDTVQRDKSTSMLKANAGVMYRTPFRLDLTTDVHYVSAQTWGLREFDASGALVVQDEEIPDRVLLSARVGYRPLKEHDLEVSATAWNILGFSESLRFQEHPTAPKLQPMVYGSVSYKF